MTVEGSGYSCKQGSLAEEMVACNGLSSHTDDFSEVGQLRSCASSHSRNHASFRTPSVPAAAAFKKGDILIRSPCPSEQATSPLTSQRHLTIPFNTVTQSVQFETPLFKGQVLVMLKGLPDTPSVFDGKKRLMWMTIQGQFKQEAGFNSLMLGSEFKRSLRLPAGNLLSCASTWLVQRMGSGVQLNTVGNNPHILAPLIASAQIINVSRPGQQPSMLDAEEDMTLFDPKLVSSWTGKPMSAAKRRSHFNSKSSRQACRFDTENIWTFHVYDHVMDYSSFMVPMPFFKVDLVQVLDGQPMQLLLKDMDSSTPMLKLEVWHKRMLEHKANTTTTTTSSSSSSTQETLARATNAGAHNIVSFDCSMISQAASSLSRSGSLQAAAITGLIKA